MVKFNGEAHVDLTPGEYTQLTGRAGRRGIDVEGHAVVIWSPEVDPRHVAGLASTRTYPLRSSFRPSYNMAVNLVGTVGAQAARQLLESSFAQFQADRSVVGLARQVQRNEETMALHEAEMSCHIGDFAEYFGLRTRIGEREKALARSSAAMRRADAVESLRRLRVGDVIRVASGRRSGLAVVLDPGANAFNEPRPLVLTEDRWAGRVSAVEFSAPVETLARLRVPKNFNHRSPHERRDLAAALRQSTAAPTRPRRRPGAGQDDEELAELRRQLRRHPCHACPDRDEHARWAERRARLARDTAALRDKVANRTGSLARTFDRVCALLVQRGYLAASGGTASGGTALEGAASRDAGEVTEAGTTLARVWTESDLLTAECLLRGVWDELDPPGLAAAVSVVVYESRRDGDERAAVPRAVADAVEATLQLWADLETAEAAHGLSLTREPDLGFVWPIYRWARGESLAKVLASVADTEMPAGDFVRWARQVIDLLGQLAAAAPAGSPVPATARAAMDALTRGLITYGG
jgi:ATP-dependent RNA helicase HelY